MQTFLRSLIILITVCLSFQTFGKDTALPQMIVPEGFGVNIHFVDPAPGEMKMIADTGLKWIRMDFTWEAIEKEKGNYDFSGYERLLKAMEPYGLRALFILDYANPLYDQGLAPYTAEGRRAFVRWATASAQHFSGRGILWEIWNEPNENRFWKPKKNVQNYISLAMEVGKAFQKDIPDEFLIAPATSHIPLGFLKKVFKSGLLEYLSAISVHPYRGFITPETSTVSLRRLQSLLKKYTPSDKEIPVYSGEWGYTSAQAFLNEVKQGKFLARMWLLNLYNGIPLSIWYDWRDGPDVKNGEHNFGLVRHHHYSNREPVLEPKPAYFAAKTLISSLKGFRFQGRLRIGGPRDYIFLFKKGEEIRLALWSSSPLRHQVEIPASPGTFRVTNFTGDKSRTLGVKKNRLTIKLSNGPQYVVPNEPNARLAKMSEQ